jgi:hypothetical protein
MAPYESEYTRFMRKWMETHPEQREEQQKGRALWWDTPQDAETRRNFDAARVQVNVRRDVQP